MTEAGIIIPPTGEDDAEGARRVFEEFFSLYHPTLLRVEYYLEEVIDAAGGYAQAYAPWQAALHNLVKGVYLTAKRIPLPDTQALTEALKIFTFESAILFLRDLCANCRIALTQDWPQRFREHINTLLFALAILQRQHAPAFSR
jgi:hypothetical protein